MRLPYQDLYVRVQGRQGSAGLRTWEWSVTGPDFEFGGVAACLTDEESERIRIEAWDQARETLLRVLRS